ncbi:MAG TPA: ComF family protein [Vicinamibacterales bacterium]
MSTSDSDPILDSIRAIDKPLCRQCLISPGPIDRSRAIGAYDGALAAIIHALKYDARRSLARQLGDRMRARGAEVLREAACVVPVPLHPSRRRQRGFNQAADLARHVGLPVVHALRRVRATTTQTHLSATERRLNLKTAFVASRAADSLTGSTVVLIDDVSTTGATLEECALTLKAAGVREVRALTAARVVRAAAARSMR